MATRMQSWLTLLVLVVLCVLRNVRATEDGCAEALKNIRSGQFAQAEASLANCNKLLELEDAVNQMRKKLGEMSTKLTQIKYSKSSTAPIEPAMQWAQSPDTIFINVKFAHKLDAPACIDVIEPNIELEESRVGIRAGCKGFDKNFKLDLPLFSSIVVSNSSWAMTSVGRGSFTLIKQVAAKWDRLLASRDKPKNLHVWWAMQEKFDSALDAMKDSATNVPTSTTEEIQKAVTPAKEEEDDLLKGLKAAKKRLQEQAKKAKREVEERATKEKAKIQKKIDAIEEEETKHVAKLDDEMKLSLGKLDEKYNQLKAKKDAGNASVSWIDDEGDSEEKPSDGSFLAAATRVLKRAFGVDKDQANGDGKDEI